MPGLSRRNTVQLLGSALAAPALLRTAWADDKVLSIGMTFPITGTLALQAGVVRDAALASTRPTRKAASPATSSAM